VSPLAQQQFRDPCRLGVFGLISGVKAIKDGLEERVDLLLVFLQRPPRQCTSRSGVAAVE
jgi:hypothetical protein